MPAHFDALTYINARMRLGVPAAAAIAEAEVIADSQAPAPAREEVFPLSRRLDVLIALFALQVAGCFWLLAHATR